MVLGILFTFPFLGSKFDFHLLVFKVLNRKEKQLQKRTLKIPPSSIYLFLILILMRYQALNFIKNFITIKSGSILALLRHYNQMECTHGLRHFECKLHVKKTLEITMQQLKADQTLMDRTEWSPKQIVRLLEICRETHFKSSKGSIDT